jgi:heat-inducible transcriptional repressor
MQEKDRDPRARLLNERSREVLLAVIQDFAEQNRPVGSRQVTKNHKFGLSAATVRNTMADLEEFGLLAQPHRSAGRIPTYKAWRLYVDHLLEVECLGMFERETIERECSQERLGLQDLMREISRTLASLSHQTGFVLSPRFEATVFCRVQFVSLSRNRVLAIFVSQAGVVQNKLLEVDETIPQETLDGMNRYLSDLLKGLTLSQVRERIVQEISDESVRYDQMLMKALSIGQKVFAEEDREGELFVEGQNHILDHMRFEDAEQMRTVLQALGEKRALLHLLDRSMQSPGLRVFIGSENEREEFKGMSFITSSYLCGGDVIGTLGILGPMHMNYGRMIPLVEYAAKHVSRIFSA